jgi:hypothetical protein
MMHVRLKLREPKGLVTPKGPSLSWAARTRIDFSGSELSFRVPRHRPEHRNNDPVFPDRYYKLDSLPLRSSYNEADAERGRKDTWRFGTLLYHSWAFCGPWFTGVLSELRLTVTFFRPVNYSQRFSLFHPRALEMAIGDYLDYMYADKLDETRGHMQEFVAPVNWQPLSHLPVNAARLEVVPQLRSAPTRTTEDLVFFPLADDLMVRCRFEPSRFKNLPNSELDKRVNIQPMHDLMNNIINSIQLKLSPEAQAQQAKALEGLADTSLVKNFPPIKWDNLDEKTTQAVLLEARSNNSSQ